MVSDRRYPVVHSGGRPHYVSNERWLDGLLVHDCCGLAGELHKERHGCSGNGCDCTIHG